MKKTHISLILFILFYFAFNNIALSWDDGVTHKALSKFAAENSVLDKNKGDYLRNLGFEKGLEEYLKWNKDKKIKDWLRDGAELEDQSGPLSIGYLNGKARAFNHFHNPLKQAPWLDAGLDDWIVLPPFHVTGKSSLRWAQEGAYQENFYEGDWSWNKTREHYYTGLTGKNFAGSEIAPDEATKKEYFARTFRGLGHQMHLIQDAGQPDHVRNDAHPEDSILKKNILNGSRYFETWAKEEKIFIKCLIENHNSLPPDIFSKCQQYNINEGVNIEDYFPNVPFIVLDNGLAPITQLFDTDTYDGYNASAGINQGIAEDTRVC